jgi:hypothetical protein
MLRARELEEQGRRPVAPDPNLDVAHLQLFAGTDDDRDYKMLRTEADTWQAKRTAFMLSRLNAGRHPDTDPHFWDGYHDYGPPVLTVPLLRRIDLWGRPYFGYGWFPVGPICFFLIALPVTVSIVRRRIARREREYPAAGTR